MACIEIKKTINLFFCFFFLGPKNAAHPLAAASSHFPKKAAPTHTQASKSEWQLAKKSMSAWGNNTRTHFGTKHDSGFSLSLFNTHIHTKRRRCREERR
jgi:hypothetical protein